MELQVVDAQAMRQIGQAVSQFVQSGDLIMLNGPLGAGKTTFVQGLAAGMEVNGRVQSPTFVIAVVHSAKATQRLASGQTGVDLVHVDAYRLEDASDLDALDLDTTLGECVTVVEWGAGKTEVLTESRLVIDIHRPVGADGDVDVTILAQEAPRRVLISAVGSRWEGVPEQIVSMVISMPNQCQS